MNDRDVRVVIGRVTVVDGILCHEGMLEHLHTRTTSDTSIDIQTRDVHGNGIRNGNVNPMGIPREWKCNMELGREIGNHLNGNGNCLHSHGNLFPQVLCCGKLFELSVGPLSTCQMPMPLVPSLPTT